MSAPLCTVYSIWFHFFVLGCFVQRLLRMPVINRFEKFCNYTVNRSHSWCVKYISEFHIYAAILSNLYSIRSDMEHLEPVFAVSVIKNHYSPIILTKITGASRNKVISYKCANSVFVLCKYIKCIRNHTCQVSCRQSTNAIGKKLRYGFIFPNAINRIMD